MSENIHGIDRYTFYRCFTAFLNSIKMTQINFCVTLFPPLLPVSAMEYTNVLSAKKTIVVCIYRYRYRCISLCFSLLRFSRRLQCIMCSTFVLLESKRHVTRIFLMTRTETKSLSETFPCSSVESSSHRTLQMSLSFIVFR